MATQASRDVVFAGVTKRYDDGTLAVPPHLNVADHSIKAL